MGTSPSHFIHFSNALGINEEDLIPTVLPFPCCGIDDPEELVVCDGFRVEIDGDRFLFHHLVGLEQ